MSDHDAHVRLWRAAWYDALRSGLGARGSLPPVEPWATDGCGGVDGDGPIADVVSPIPNAVRLPAPEYVYWGGRRDVDWDELFPYDRLPYYLPAPTTGSQWCGVLHPDAPDDAVVREQRSSIWYREWTYVPSDGVQHTVTAGTVSRSASPATPASIPHARDDGRVEWRDDPAEVWLHALPSDGGRLLLRARLLGGTAAGDPPSPWWEGDGRDRRAAE